MNAFVLTYFIANLALTSLAWAANSNAPEQVHISLGADETEMIVTWATLHHIGDTGHVQFGESSGALTHSVPAEVSAFTDGAHLYTYRALLSGLKPAHQYYYQVGSAGSSWSKVFHFHTLPSGSSWLPRLAIYGDLGFQNEESLPFLSKDVEKDLYNVIFHIGDFAYDLNERHGEQGNDFMRSIEKVASKVPYMTVPGNHEHHSNFSHYDARFTMLSDRGHSGSNHQASLKGRINNHFHSIDIGPAHIVMFSTEFYYYTEYGWEQIARQYEWLEADLKRANENRAQKPWLIVMGHRPLYCIKIGDGSCNYDTLERPDLRQGVHMHKKKDAHRQYALEPLFYKYGVDLQFYGHEHFFGRMLPMFNYTVMGGMGDGHNPYDGPRAPVHITTGSAGNRERHPKFNSHLKSWVAAHHFDYGYTRLIFKDKYQVTLEQTSDDQGGKVLDKVDIIKHSDKPFWMA